MSGYKKIAVIITALIVIFVSDEFIASCDEIIFLFAIINTAISALGWSFFCNYLLTFWDIIRRISNFLIAHQALGIGEKVIDFAMITAIYNYGVIYTFFLITPIYFIYCIFIVRLYDFFLRRGYDLLELENLRNMEFSKDSKFLKWIMKRKITIFIFGSFWQLDPDGVTILLRNKQSSFLENTLKITLPAVMLSMIYWTTIFFLALKGFRWAKWLVE